MCQPSERDVLAGSVAAGEARGVSAWWVRCVEAGRDRDGVSARWMPHEWLG